MNGDVLAQYLNECLLKAKQTLAHVSDSPRKPSTGDKIKPLGFQRVGLESGQPRVTWLGHFVVSSKMGKCWFQHVQLRLEE
jgi:hypothetical protein